MMTARVAGQQFELDAATVERAVVGVDPEPIAEHFVVIRGRRYPPKQVIASVTSLDRADFTTHQARSVLRRLGFGVYRRSGETVRLREDDGPGPRQEAEATALEPYRGRWIAQDGLEVLFDADSPESVLRWLRRHGRRARVWRVPSKPADAGSMLSTL
jgi:hypothetical protein